MAAKAPLCLLPLQMIWALMQYMLPKTRLKFCTGHPAAQYVTAEVLQVSSVSGRVLDLSGDMEGKESLDDRGQGSTI